MSPLPIQGLPAPTHPFIPPPVLWRYTQDLVKAAAGGKVTLAMIEQVAEAQQAPVEQVYAAMALDPNLVFAFEHPVLLAVCVGKCQTQGALDLLAMLLKERKKRGNFDVLVRNCFDMCMQAPVVISRSELGQALHPKTTPEQLTEVLDTLCAMDENETEG